MTTPERKVKLKVAALLREHGAYFFTPIGAGYGRSGVPDIVACLNGRFIGIECKANKGKPTALQAANLAHIFSTGGVALVIDEHNVEDLRTCLAYVTTQPSASGYGNFGTSREKY